LKEKAAWLPGGLFVLRDRIKSNCFANAPEETSVSCDPYFSTDGGTIDEEERGGNMFCDRCGAPAQPDQRFCGRCGKEFTGGVVAAFPRRSRVAEHIRFLGILWLALSALNAVGGLVLFVLANTLFAHLHEMPNVPPDVPAGFLHSLFSVLGFIVLAKAAAGFIAGWGLLQREPWARMLTIVLAFLALFNIPFGTALGIYSLWVLLPAGADAEYAEQVRSVGAA